MLVKLKGSKDDACILVKFELTQVLASTILDHVLSQQLTGIHALCLYISVTILTFLFLHLLHLLFHLFLTFLPMIPIYMSQIPTRLNNIPHPPLELLRLREPAIFTPIPEHPR